MSDSSESMEHVLALAALFRAEGYELYMVGGTVRDLLLGRASSPDVDLTTNARPEAIKRLVARTQPAAVVTVGEQFGTVRVHYQRRAPDESVAAGASEPSSAPAPVALIVETPPNVDVIEITTYRSDTYQADSRKPEVTFGDTLEGDLLRRDFTINAMARDPMSGDIIDPYGGRMDLAKRLIRAVGDQPGLRFQEDPLRMLRAARFAAQLDFTIEEGTAAAITRQAGLLQRISRERIRDEFTKVLASPRPALGLRLLVNLGLMPYIVPEVMELRGVSQRPAHSKDVYDHVLKVVERIPARPAARWAALLHDIAKPRTKTVEHGKVHFFGHEDVGANMARDILRRLRFDRPFIDYVSGLVGMHMRANAYASDWTDGAVRRLMLEAGPSLPDLLDLSRADITSYRPEKVSQAEARVDELGARARWLREEAERVPLKSPLDGNDLMSLFERGPGPWLRPVKDHLLNLVIDGTLAPDDREGALSAARQFLEAQERGEPAAATPPRLTTESAEAAALRAEGSPQARTGDQNGVGEERPSKQEARAATRRQSRRALTPRQTPPGQAPSPTEHAAQTSTGALSPNTPGPGRGPEQQGPPQATAPDLSAKTRTGPRRRDSNPIAPAPVPTDDPAPASASKAGGTAAARADRDAITRFLDEYLQVGRFRDVAPNGMQVIGKPDVRRVALGVSANLALLEQAAREGADLILVHHGMFLEREPHVVLAQKKRRLQVVFTADMTLLAYHLPLDAHSVVGNNALWLAKLGFVPEASDFSSYQGQSIGAIGVRETPISRDDLVRAVAAIAGGTVRVYPYGPEQVRRLGVATGAAPSSLSEAIAQGLDAFLTGEVAEGTQALAQEEGANFLAAGHYNTERLGVQALGDLLRERFGVETFFIEVPNDV